jgi:hypothetical protein
VRKRSAGGILRYHQHLFGFVSTGAEICSILRLMFVRGWIAKIMLVLFTSEFGAVVARANDQPLTCRVQKICPNGETLSCEARGSGAQCDVSPTGVSCRYYLDGQFIVDEEHCRPIFQGSDEEAEVGRYETKAVSDADVIVRRPDGQYDVKCNDGSRERVDKPTLDSGEICKGGSSNGRFQIRCDGFGSNYYPVRSSDGVHFGTFISGQECREIAESSLNQTTCASVMPGTFHITRILDGQRLGERTSLNYCLQSSLFNRQGVTCVPYGSGWRLMSVKHGMSYGANNTGEACLYALRNAREGVACVDQGGGRWVIMELSTQQRIGHHSTLDACAYATDNAFSGRVCAPVGGDRWQVVDIRSRVELSDRLDLNACVTQL